MRVGSDMILIVDLIFFGGVFSILKVLFFYVLICKNYRDFSNRNYRDCI